MDNERYRVFWEDQPGKRKPVERRRGWSLWSIVLSGLGVLGVIGLLVTRPKEIGTPFDGVPREIAGRWVTNDPQYADRQLVIERDRVDLLLELGPAGRERHPIQEVRGWDTSNGRGYRVRYGVEGEYAVDVFVTPDGTLRLKNPPEVVWRRLPFVYF
jgi:hypothetical protein